MVKQLIIELQEEVEAANNVGGKIVRLPEASDEEGEGDGANELQNKWEMSGLVSNICL